jgi:hypothetical protein
MKQTIILLLVLALVNASLPQDAFALRPISSKLDMQQTKTAYCIQPGVFQAEGMPEPSRQKLLHFIRQNNTRIPEQEKETIKALKKSVFAIEASIGVLKYTGILPIIGGIFSGLPAAGAIVGAAILCSSGILRLAVLVWFKIRNPRFRVHASLYFITLIPFMFGFTYTIAYLYFPHYRFRDLMLIRDIIYKVNSSLYWSTLGQETEFSFQQLIDNIDIIAMDIMRYQRAHFGVFTSKYRKFFKIRSARWVTKKEAKMYAHLSKGKRLLFIDSNRLLGRISALLKARFGFIILDRVYYYDIGSLIKDIARAQKNGAVFQNSEFKETYIKHMFEKDDYGLSAATEKSLEVLEIRILTLLNENPQAFVEFKELMKMLEGNIGAPELSQALDSLYSEGLIRKIEIKLSAGEKICISRRFRKNIFAYPSYETF